MEDGTDSLLDLVDQLRRKAEDADKTNPSFIQNRAAKRAQALAGLASSAFSDGDLLSALGRLSQAIVILPSAPLYTKRAVVHLALRHDVLAAADAVCAVGTDPNYASGYLCAALAKIRLNVYEEALEYLEKLRRCFPNSKKTNSLYVSCRNTFWLTGKIQPQEIPISIAKDLVQEEYSAFDENKLDDLKAELSSSGVLEASKLTEDFVKRVIETYKRGVFHLPQKYVIMILKNTLDILKESPNIVSIDISPKQTLTVVGDLRGRFDNLLSIFRHNRSPHFGRPYLFNGNVIGNDRMSLPVLIIVLCFKLLFPEDVFINRGSEECLEMCEANGFETEVLTVYDEDTMKNFSEVFNWLPVAHVLNNNVLIIHGGLFEDEQLTLADLQLIDRWYQPPDSGPMSHVLHSDPWNYQGTSKKGRRRGVWFGPDVTERFCLYNCIDYVVRSHQDVGELGYEVQNYRQCLTVDSSTNYATYLVIRGKTSSYKAVHARKDRHLPKHCKCFMVCNCKSPGAVKMADPLHDGYMTTDLALPEVPSILKDDSEESHASQRSTLSKPERSHQSNLSSKSAILVNSTKSTSRASASASIITTKSPILPSEEKDPERLTVVSTPLMANYSSTTSDASSIGATSKRSESRATSNSKVTENLSSTTSSAEIDPYSLAHATSNVGEKTQVIGNTGYTSEEKESKSLFASSKGNLSTPTTLARNSSQASSEHQQENATISAANPEQLAPNKQQIEDIPQKQISSTGDDFEKHSIADVNEIDKIAPVDEPIAQANDFDK